MANILRIKYITRQRSKICVAPFNVSFVTNAVFKIAGREALLALCLHAPQWAIHRASPHTGDSYTQG